MLLRILGSLPSGMTPRFGFGAADRVLPEHEGVAAVTHVSPRGSDPVEIGGRWRLGFSVKPTPRRDLELRARPEMVLYSLLFAEAYPPTTRVYGR